VRRHPHEIRLGPVNLDEPLVCLPDLNVPQPEFVVKPGKVSFPALQHGAERRGYVGGYEHHYRERRKEKNDVFGVVRGGARREPPERVVRYHVNVTSVSPAVALNPVGRAGGVISWVNAILQEQINNNIIPNDTPLFFIYHYSPVF